MIANENDTGITIDKGTSIESRNKCDEVNLFPALAFAELAVKRYMTLVRA